MSATETSEPTEVSAAGPSWITELRARLAEPEPVRKQAGASRRAAVLVPLYVEAGELWLFLTRRSDELPQHSGQVAFPGGGCELGEAAWDAALRESNEEVGLDGRRVARIGQLDDLETFSGYTIRPCVGAVPFPFETRINEAEIAEVFSIPLTAFADARVVEDRVVTVNDVDRSIRIYHVGRHQVWGLTARIIQNLLERCGLELPVPA